jgi:hypothetical protein
VILAPFILIFSENALLIGGGVNLSAFQMGSKRSNEIEFNRGYNTGIDIELHLNNQWSFLPGIFFETRRAFIESFVFLRFSKKFQINVFHIGWLAFFCY